MPHALHCNADATTATKAPADHGAISKDEPLTCATLWSRNPALTCGPGLVSCVGIGTCLAPAWNFSTYARALTLVARRDTASRRQHAEVRDAEAAAEGKDKDGRKAEKWLTMPQFLLHCNT